MPRKPRDLPWIAKRGTTYYACFYDTQTRRTGSLSLRTADPQEAATRFAAFLTDGTLACAGHVENGGLLVSTCLTQYLEEHCVKHAVDWKRQKNAIDQLKGFFGLLPVRELDIPQSRAYAAHRRTGGLGEHARSKNPATDSTIRRELNVLRAAVAHARRWKRLGASDQPEIELPREAAPQETLWLTRDEFGRLWQNATGPLKDFIGLAYYTAGRRASIEALQVYQIDLAGKRINLQKRGGRVTKKRRPIVPIHPAIELTVRRLIEGKKEQDYVFGESVDFYKQFHWLCRRIGTDVARSHPHVLRHSRATHLLQAGVNPYDVAKLLGDTLATVERVYGHHSEDGIAAAIGDR